MKSFSIKSRAFTLVEIMIVVLIIGILVSIAVPNFLNARAQSQKNSCIANLHQIESAKEQWAMLNQKGGNDTPTSSDLVGSVSGGFIKSFPTCPGGGSYSLNNMASRPSCSLSSDGHALQ